MRRTTLITAVLGCALALAVGCGESSGDPPAPDGAPPAGDGPQKKDTGGGKKDTGPSGKQGNGSPCSGPGQCKSDKCQNGKCVNGTAPDGAPCAFPEQCAKRKCISGKCGGGGTGKKPNGAACGGSGGECQSGICHASKCAKPCSKPGDCPAGQVCNSDDGKRVFCYTPKYNSKLGAFCGVDGACGAGLTCVGNMYDHATYCRGTCNNDMDCPPTLECETSFSGSPKYCRPRRFCSGCVHDGNCRDGMKCAAMAGGKFCARACTPGSTECPMFAQCKAAGSLHVCQPKTGSCRGHGGVCSGCSKNDHCKSGGMCLSMSLSGESFCGAPCTSSASCGGGNKCYNVGTTGQKQCGPGVPAGGKYPTCSSGVTFPIFNKGDRMDDFAMVGYKDTNNNGTLTDETSLQVVKLSHYAKTAKLILLNISAFW